MESRRNSIVYTYHDSHDSSIYDIISIHFLIYFDSDPGTIRYIHFQSQRLPISAHSITVLSSESLKKKFSNIFIKSIYRTL